MNQDSKSHSDQKRKLAVLLTESQKQSALEEYINGASASEIACKYTVSSALIYKLLKAAGIQKRQLELTDAQIDYIVEEYQKGKNAIDLSKAIGFSNNAICRALKKRGVAIRVACRWDYQKGIQIAAIYRQGVSIETIAKQMHLPIHRVYLFLEKAGVETNKQVAGPTSFTPNYNRLDLSAHTYPGIYKFTNQINGKIYIGSAQNIYVRYKGHAYMYKHGAGFPSALKKYGIGNFSFEVIERIDDINALVDRETYWICFHKACDPNIGYNLTPEAGTTRGIKQRPEVVEAMRQRLVGRFVGPLSPKWGKKNSAETRAKIAAAAKGRKVTAETRSKLSIAQRNKAPLSPEVKARVSVAICRANKKSVAQIDPDTGEVIRVWDSLKQLKTELGHRAASVGHACRGYWYDNRNKTRRVYNGNPLGFKWEFTDLEVTQPKRITFPPPIQVKRVAQIELITNKVLKIWPSSSVAAQENNIKESGIRDACRGYYMSGKGHGRRHKDSHGGYKWQYTDLEPVV